MTYEDYLATKDQTEIYYAVMTKNGRYRHICDGWPMKNPINASLYDSVSDVLTYGTLYDGDVI